MAFGSVVRSPADVLRLVVAASTLLLLLVLGRLFADTLVAFSAELLSGLDAVPDWIVDLVVIGTKVLTVVVLVGGLVVTVWRAGWRMLTTVAAAGVLGVVLFVVLDGLIDDPTADAPVDVALEVGPLSDSAFPDAASIAATAAVLTAAAPWLSRRWRRAGWVLVLGLTITRFFASPVSFELLVAVVIGWFSGAAVLVLMGAPSRRPTRAAVRDGLSRVGLPVRSLEPASVDARGSTPYFGVAADDSPLFVKVLGDDERSADLLFRLYRRLKRRNFGDEKAFSTLRRAVEHEALVALAARDLGVRTPALRAFATAEPNGYVLAYEAIAGRSLDRLAPSEVDDALLEGIWGLVAQLQQHRIAHRDLRLANIFRDDDGAMWLIDFGFSELAASDLLLATDVAELIASSSIYVGAERAVAGAARAVEPARLAQAGDRLHLWSLSGATRTAHKGRPGLLDELRRGVAAAAPAPTGRS